MRKICAALVDFDGTTVKKDILDVLCTLLGPHRGRQSRAINKRFHDGELDKIDALTQRINLLDGLQARQIWRELRKNFFLREGARELTAFFRDNGIVSILNSGQIMQTLLIYQHELGINHVVGTHPLVEHGVIRGIPADRPIIPTFKLDGCKVILDKLGIDPEEVVAIGDSLADEDLFRFAGLSIAVSPKDGIKDIADHVIRENLRDAISIIRETMN